MTRFLVSAATVAALSLPFAATAQDMSPEMQARLKAAASAESSNEQRIYINGRLFNAEHGSYVSDDDGSVYIRTDSDFSPNRDDVSQDPAGGPLTEAEIKALCGSDDSNDRRGLPCDDV